MAHLARPSRREDFEIAIICALQIESDAVEALLDDEYEIDGFSYDKAPGDRNTYTTGRLGNHHVVLAYLPGMGKASSAAVASNIMASFKGINLALVVGICGGVPGAAGQTEILLGDVIISTAVVQIDFGRQYPNKFIRKDTLGRANPEIRSFLTKASGYLARKRLKEKTAIYSSQLSKKDGFHKSEYPGAEKDKLFPPNYRHKHRNANPYTICRKCWNQDDDVCETALNSSCTELGCDEGLLVRRDRVQKAKGIAPDGNPIMNKVEVGDAQKASIHFGRVASGDGVMKSGLHRDEIAIQEKVVAFEMESAGAWDYLPTIVIKSVCDYADSHKNKQWQEYAAATAAACTKAFLEERRSVDPPIFVSPQNSVTTAPIVGRDLTDGVHMPSITNIASPLVVSRIVKRPEWQIFLSPYNISGSDIFERLSNYDYQRVYSRLARRKLEHTAKWILKNLHFDSWLNDGTPQCLWLSGIIGCGKSITITTVIDAAVARAQKVGRPVLYYIYDHSFRRYLTALALFESYTKQLLCYLECLNKVCPSVVVAHILEFYGPKKRRPDVCELMNEILIPLLGTVKGVMFIVDGLDECSQREIQSILAEFRKILTNPSCQIFISCREGIDVLTRIPGSVRIRITPDNTKADMELFVDKEIGKMQDERRITDKQEVLEDIKQELLKKADRMFLWAHLQVKLLWEECAGDNAVDDTIYKTLQRLPDDLNETYRRCQSNVNRDNRRQSLASRALRLISVAVEPFKISQLQEALVVDPKTGELKNGPIQKDEIIACCTSLAYLEKDGLDELILLAHHSVRQFLFSSASTLDLSQESAELELGELCIVHLYRHMPVREVTRHESSGKSNRTALPIQSNIVSAVGSAIAPRIFRLRTPHSLAHIQFPAPACQNVVAFDHSSFLYYAKRNWILLTRNISTSSSCLSKFEKLTLFNSKSWWIYPWQQSYIAFDSHISTIYGWSIINCHYSLLSLAIDQQARVQGLIYSLPLYGQDGKQPIFPFQTAAEVGDVRVIELLFKVLPQQNGIYEEGLCIAAEQGHEAIVRLLLERRVGINAKNSRGHTALHIAVQQGHWAVVRLLLNMGANPTFAVLEGHGGTIRSVAFSPDGKLLASNSGDGTVMLWDAATGSSLRTLERHSGSVRLVVFSPDGKLLASSSVDGTVMLWDAATGSPLWTLEGHWGIVYSVVFSPDGKLLASSLDDGTVMLRDAATGSLLQSLERHSGSVYSVAFSPDGKLLASTSVDGTVRLWDAATGSPLRTLESHSGSAYSVVFSPDGKLLASNSIDRTVMLWDAATGSPLRTLEGHSGHIYSSIFSPGGKLLASSSEDGTVRLWDAATGLLLRTLEGHRGSVYSVIFSPGGKLLASSSVDGTVRLWDAATGSLLQSLRGHSKPVASIAFSPNGKLLASGSDDRTVKLWDVTIIPPGMA